MRLQNITLITTCAFGLEAVLKQELARLGFERLTVSDGKLEFAADMTDIPRLNIGLRTADRVLLKLDEFDAENFDQLFDRAKAVPWEKWIPQDAKLTVVGRSSQSVLQSVRTCQSMIKKAIVQRYQSKFKISWLPETGPEFNIHFSLFKDRAQISLDTTGPGLNKRGYRSGTGEAALRENLAAALLLLSTWRGGKTLVDPFCGSGTILIEAALIARRIAPGLHRNFAAEAWAPLPKPLWDEARRAAEAEVLPALEGTLRGYDKSPARIKDSRMNARQAGVDRDIIFERRDVSDLKLPEGDGVIVTNPPYGINAGDQKELPALYRGLRKTLNETDRWAVHVFTADKRFKDHFSQSRPDKIRKLYNGTIEAHYHYYHAYKPGTV